MIPLYGDSKKIGLDNGLEFISEVFEKWALEQKIHFKFIEVGKPHQNEYIERFNRSFRDEVYDAYSFNRIRAAEAMTHTCLWIYHNVRSNSSLGYLPSVTFLDERNYVLRGVFPYLV